jgi:hypothetical protein
VGPLRIFHDVQGRVSLYEVSPLPESRLLAKFFDPQFSEELYRSNRW